MSQDEQAIREVIATWHRATAEGDGERIRGLMAEDAVFLVAGQPPMRGRDAFLASFAQVIAEVEIVSRGEVQEIEVAGDLAYCWTQLTVTTRPRQANAEGARPETRRAGPTLTLFRREPDGRWVLFRDANLLAPATPEPRPAA